MIITRTPFRISFFGGGTDFPAWYLKHGGSVISTSIDKYCQLTCRYLPPFFEHRVRLVWSKIENCSSIEEVTHPAVKAIVKQLGMDRCLEIHHIGDLPARSGMGSSSAFTVGLLHALYALKGRMVSKQELSRLAIDIEQNVLNEAVGSQDQVSAAYGGFNRIDFSTNGEISVTPMTLNRSRIDELNGHLMLFYTGIKRTSSDIAQKLTNDIEARRRQLRIMKDIVDEAVDLLNSSTDINAFGELMREGWEAKRNFSEVVSNSEIEQMLKTAYDAGAIGGKITGAGAGGFLLLFVPPARQRAVKKALRRLLYVPFKFEFAGSQIIFAAHDYDYSAVEMSRDTQDLTPFREYTEIIETDAHFSQPAIPPASPDNIPAKAAPAAQTQPDKETAGDARWAPAGWKVITE